MNSDRFVNDYIIVSFATVVFLEMEMRDGRISLVDTICLIELNQ